MGDLTLQNWTREQVQAVLLRRPAAVREFVAAAGRLFQREIAYVLLRHRRHAEGRELRQELEDLAQEAFAALFAQQGQRLRAWEPDRGSLQTFLSVFVQHHTISQLRSRRRNPWTERPTEAHELERPDDADPTARLGDRELLRHLLSQAHAHMRQDDLDFFERVFCDETPLEQVAAETGMSIQAVYQRKSRVRRRLASLLSVLAPGGPPRRR